MALTKQTGRPKIPWNASRSRKLVRLYLMTDLSIPRIQEVLKATDFAPGRRNIQGQLKTLIPEYSTTWRRHRPSREQMRNRLAQLRKSREKRAPKQLQAQSECKVKIKMSRATETAHNRQGMNDDEDNNLSSNEIAFSATPRRYVPARPANLDPDDRSAAKESPISKGLGNTRSFEHETISPTISTSKDPASTLSLASPENSFGRQLSKQAVPILDSSEPLSTPSSPLSHNSSLKLLRSEGSIIRIGSIRSVHSTGRESVKTSSTRSFCSIRHLNSVLSPTLSLRSSLGYTTSLSSKHQSSGSTLPWTIDELNSWKELVDESAFPPKISRPEDVPEKSLRDRPCCNFFNRSRPTWKATSLCNTCGFSEMHWRARFSKVADTAWMDPTSLDHFRNTPLHHAAAAGNTAQVLNLMSSLVRPSSTNSQRNTSGETFLHVFRLKAAEQFSAYEEVLEKASSQGFPFDAVDHQGQRVSQILEDLLDDWSISSTRLTKVARILGIDEIPQCHDGKLKPRDLTKSWYEYENSRKASETKLMSTLKNWDNEKDSDVCLRSLIRDSDIHIRDERGYTALAIAAGNGVHEAVTLLLEAGANPNTRSYRKTSVMEYADRNLRLAQKKGQNVLYALIISCMALLSDHGGKANVSVRDEYGMIDESPKYRVTNSRSRQSSTSAITRKSAIRGRPRRQLESIVEPSHQPEEPSRKIRPSSPFKDEEIIKKTAASLELESAELDRWRTSSGFELPKPGDATTVPDRSNFDAIFQEGFSYVNGFNESQIAQGGSEEEFAMSLLPSFPPTSGSSGRPLQNHSQDDGCSGQLEAGKTYTEDVPTVREEGERSMFQRRHHSISVHQPTERYLASGTHLEPSESELNGTESLTANQSHTSWSFKNYQSPVIPTNSMVSSMFPSHRTANLNAVAQSPRWLLPEQTIIPPPLPPRNIKHALPARENGLHEARLQQAETQNLGFGDNMYSFRENSGTTTGITPQIRDFTFAPYDPTKAVIIEDTAKEAQELSFDQAYQWYGTASITTPADINENDKVPRAQQRSPLEGLSEVVPMEKLVTQSDLEPISTLDTMFPVVDSYEAEAFNPAKRRRMAPKSDMLEVLLEQGWSGWR